MPTATSESNRLVDIPSIPQLEAVTFEEVKTSGKSMPMAMLCINSAGEVAGTYIVKLYASIALREASLAREIYAALLGHALGLNIPPAAIVNISPDFYKVIKETVIAERVKVSPGLNFGSKYYGQQNLPPLDIPASHLAKAADVFAFDMLIRNYDRRRDNPNMSQTADGYIIIDHEEALSYALPHTWLGGVKEPWDIRETAVQHIFYRQLKGRQAEFDAFCKKLSLVSDELLDTIEEQIPRSWKSDEITHIRSYLRNACANYERVKRGLQEVLSQ
jgi:hypothetical protein